jgi:hypothetical protein
MVLGAAASGVLIWFAGRFDSPNQHDYWISIGLLAAAGLVMGLALLRRGAGRGAGTIVALPFVAATLWIVLAAQPNGGGTIRTWSHDIGIGGIVADLAVNVGVIAFGATALFGASALLSRRRTETVVETPAAADDLPQETTTVPVDSTEDTRVPDPVA